MKKVGRQLRPSFLNKNIAEIGLSFYEQMGVVSNEC